MALYVLASANLELPTHAITAARSSLLYPNCRRFFCTPDGSNSRGRAHISEILSLMMPVFLRSNAARLAIRAYETSWSDERAF